MRFYARRVVQLAAVLLVVSFLTFLLIRLLPGDPVVAIAGPVDDAEAERIRDELGLNDFILVQYGDWMSDALRGDLGDSYVSKRPVTELLSDVVPRSVQLMLYAQLLALAVAIPLGVAAAYKADTLFDRVASTTAFGLLSVPGFISGVLLVYLFAIRLGWLPATGYERFGDDPVGHFRHMFLPAVTLALGLIPIYMRLLRTDMVATLQEDFIGMAKAKGLPTRRILLRHAFRPSSFSLLTVAGISIGNLIGGAFIVEQIFAIPGLGRTLVFAIFQRDYLLVQGGVLLICVSFVLINFAVDMLYAVLDPRIRHARAAA